VFGRFGALRASSWISRAASGRSKMNKKDLQRAVDARKH